MSILQGGEVIFEFEDTLCCTLEDISFSVGFILDTHNKTAQQFCTLECFIKRVPIAAKWEYLE
jgi:hypothetical protein